MKKYYYVDLFGGEDVMYTKLEKVEGKHGYYTYKLETGKREWEQAIYIDEIIATGKLTWEGVVEAILLTEEEALLRCVN